jgi:hypothetical protein
MSTHEKRAATSTEGANSHERSGHHHCHFLLNAVWRAAYPLMDKRTEGASAQPTWPSVNLSGTKDRGSGCVWITIDPVTPALQKVLS